MWVIVCGYRISSKKVSPTYLTNIQKIRHQHTFFTKIFHQQHYSRFKCFKQQKTEKNT